MPQHAPARYRLARRLAFVALVTGAVPTLAGCNPDIFDVSVLLAKESYPVDFGTSMGNVPTTTCAAGDTMVCGSGQNVTVDGGAGTATVTLACDGGKSLCYAQANVTATATVDVLQDDSFTSAVGRRAVSVVRMVDLQYTVPSNTTTFTLPEIDVYVGPAGSAATTDPGVVPVDKTEPLAAGAIFTDARHLTVADGSPARDLIETDIRNESPFVFLIAAAPRLEAGAPLPAGKLEIDVQPLVGLGLR